MACAGAAFLAAAALMAACGGLAVLTFASDGPALQGLLKTVLVFGPLSAAFVVGYLARQPTFWKSGWAFEPGRFREARWALLGWLLAAVLATVWAGVAVAIATRLG